MATLLLDTDGLIKLNRAGVLTKVLELYSCVIPRAVYDEAVSEGKRRQYQDADAIEAAVADKAQVLPVQGLTEPDLGLGAGETGILSLLRQMPDPVVVSDDRRFLTVLSMAGIAFLTPADVLVLMARQGLMSIPDAREALDSLRPAIRTQAYWDARQDLESEGEGHGQD